jgi:uncharacterized protein YbjT (DUF2867 family)
MTILVTGASGHVGRGVLTALLAAHATIRVSSRSPHPGFFPASVEVVQADLTAPHTFPAALDGVRKVFLYAHPESAAEFAAAAVDAGVEHVVVLSSSSVIPAGAEHNPIARRHLAVEEAIVQSGLDWTFVRPGYYATNMLRWHTIRSDRHLRTAFPHATSSPVHERDIADIAARSLLDDDQRGRAHAVLGSGPTTVREQVAAIARAIHESIELVEIGVPTYRKELLTQLPEFAVDRLIASRGNLPVLPDDIATDSVLELLHRPPLSFADWAADHAADFQ